MKVYYVFSLELSHPGNFNEYTQYIIFNIKKKITLNYPISSATGFFLKGLKNEFKIAVVNEPSLFEPLKIYCIVYWARQQPSIYNHQGKERSVIHLKGYICFYIISCNLPGGKLMSMSHMITKHYNMLTLKAPNKNCSRRHFNFFSLLSFEENKA